VKNLWKNLWKNKFNNALIAAHGYGFIFLVKTAEKPKRFPDRG